MNRFTIFYKTYISLFLFAVFAMPMAVSASTGTILSGKGAAWSNEIGWVNFAPSNGGLSITDSAVTGSAWSENYGWINFAPANGGVINDGEGNLSGTAWGDNIGWISFSGVSINTSTGKFSGQATGTLIGILTFDCSNCDVETDWRPTVSTSSTSTPPASGGGGVGSPVQPPAQPVVTQPSSSGSNNTSQSSSPASGQNQQAAPPAQSTQTQAPPSSPSQPSQGTSNSISGISQLIGQIKNIVNTKIGSIVTKTISTIGIIAGVTASILTIILTSQAALSDIWMILFRIFDLMVELFGLKKKARPWGTVYDAITKRPLDPAYVSLTDAATGKTVSTAITDLDGRYGFLVKPGKYKILGQKTNYSFPSMKMKGSLYDAVYNDLYFGDEITVTAEGEIITKNIPMDPLKFDWNEFAKNRANMTSFTRAGTVLWAKISDTLFVIGAFVALIGLIFVPAPYNLIIAGTYVTVYLLNFVVFKTKKAGTLLEKSNGLPLSFALINIFMEGQESPIAKKVADKFGRYYILVPKGRYHIKIDKKNDDESYTEVFSSPVMDVKNGVVNWDIDA